MKNLLYPGHRLIRFVDWSIRLRDIRTENKLMQFGDIAGVRADERREVSLHQVETMFAVLAVFSGGARAGSRKVIPSTTERHGYKAPVRCP